MRMKLSGFSREYGYLHYCRFPEETAYYRGSAQAAYFTAALKAYARQRAIPSARGSVTAPSPRRS